MRQQLHDAGARGLVVGLSGGLDSAVVARLAQLAAPGAVVAALLPCHSDAVDEAAQVAVATQFSLPTIRIDLSASYDTLAAAALGALKTSPAPARTPAPADRQPLEEIKPRLRMTALYFLAGSLNSLVAGTANRSTIAAGQFTNHGDSTGDMLPLGRLLRRDVTALARDLGVPQAVIARAEQSHTSDELDRYLAEGPDGVSPATALKMERMLRSSEQSSQLPPMPEA